MQINFSTAPVFNPKTPDLFISKAILASLQYKHVDGLNQERSHHFNTISWQPTLRFIEHIHILLQQVGNQPAERHSRGQAIDGDPLLTVS